jgi:hypothetical protein
VSRWCRSVRAATAVVFCFLALAPVVIAPTPVLSLATSRASATSCSFSSLGCSRHCLGVMRVLSGVVAVLRLYSGPRGGGCRAVCLFPSSVGVAALSPIGGGGSRVMTGGAAVSGSF